MMVYGFHATILLVTLHLELITLVQKELYFATALQVMALCVFVPRMVLFCPLLTGLCCYNIMISKSVTLSYLLLRSLLHSARPAETTFH